MIVLFTDFGLSGPYVGQMKAVLAQAAPQLPVIDLFADAPAHDIHASAHLLASYHQGFPAGTVFLCVVDPGVGSDKRKPMILHADGHWYVGPANGLFDVVAARSQTAEAWRITWQPQVLSASFHGRDLFAPVAAQLACGEFPEAARMDYTGGKEYAADLAQVIYIDHFGNLLTGLRAAFHSEDMSLQLAGQQIPRVRTFSDVAPGQALCYCNSSGLLEIAVNQGRADTLFKATIGTAVQTDPCLAR